MRKALVLGIVGLALLGACVDREAQRIKNQERIDFTKKVLLNGKVLSSSTGNGGYSTQTLVNYEGELYMCKTYLGATSCSKSR
jgi:hypothetical protein